MWNEDTTGVRRTKPTKPGYNLELHSFQKAIDWIAGHILGTHGIKITSATHDPELDNWIFYEHEDPVATVPHEMINRILTSLEKMDWKFEDKLLEETFSDDIALEWIREKEEEEEMREKRRRE